MIMIKMIIMIRVNFHQLPASKHIQQHGAAVLSSQPAALKQPLLSQTSRGGSLTWVMLPLGWSKLKVKKGRIEWDGREKRSLLGAEKGGR